MNRLYIALVSAPLLFGCGKAQESLDTKVADSPPAQTMHLDTRTADYFPSAQTAQTGTQAETQETQIENQQPPCSGPPDIQKLFTIYVHLKAEVDKKPAATFGAIERTYKIAEREMERARNALAECEKKKHAIFYDLANNFAMSALNWMTETTIRANEPICVRTSGEEF